MYSLLYISLVRPDYKQACDDEDVKFKENMEKVFKDVLKDDEDDEDDAENEDEMDDAKSENPNEEDDDQEYRQLGQEIIERSGLLGRTVFLAMVQISLTLLVLLEIMANKSGDIDWSAQPENIWIVFTRFICGIVLHVSLSAELQQGMTMMKFAVNHWWKFDDWYVAYLTGSLQTSVVLLVEIVNFVALITNTTVLDIVMNFLALVIIAEFDDYFFNAVTNSELVDVINDSVYDKFLIVQTTTSSDADLMIE